MAEEQTGRARPLRRGDVAHLAELRFKYLAETARLEPRMRLIPEARDRVTQAVTAWHGQEDLIVFVAEVPPPPGSPPARESDAGDSPPLSGYAVGLYSVWPPIWRTQRVGEVSEVFVLPELRGKGIGRALLAALCGALSRRGAEVLRAPVPVRNEPSVARFRALGFEPLMRRMDRPMEGR